MLRSSSAGATSAPFAALFLLAASACVSGLVAGGLALWLSAWDVSAQSALIVAVGAALLGGLLVSLALLIRLRALDGALARLAQGSPLPESHLNGRRWPLGRLFQRVAALNEHMAHEVERERQAVAYREELMRQAREAAAREERNRLARELHDSIKQQLFSIGISAAAARTRSTEGSAEAMAALDDITRSTHEAQVEMTALLQQLRPAPLENIGLVEALRDQCAALGYRTGAEVSVTVGELPAEDQLPLRAQESLFRMAQEMLANVARHARAEHVELRLECDDAALTLAVCDDGQGFDTTHAQGGMGLSNLRERAQALGGRVELQSSPGDGATIRISIPLTKPPMPLPAEELERRAELDAMLEQGGKWFKRCLTALQIGALLIWLGLPFWSIGLALVTAMYTYAQGYRARRQVARLAGRGSEQELSLRSDEREWLALLLLLLALCVWYAPVIAPRAWSSQVVLVGVIAGSAALLLFSLFSWGLWQRATLRYYRLLPTQRRRWALEKRRDACIGAYVTVAIVVVLGLLFGPWQPAVPPHTAGEWSDAAGIALLIVIAAFNTHEFWQTLRWRSVLFQKEEEEVANE